jgi:hypothetical protein
VRSLPQSSQPAERALHTRRGALAVDEPTCRDWMVTGAIVVPWAVSMIVITKVQVLVRGSNAQSESAERCL